MYSQFKWTGGKSQSYDWKSKWGRKAYCIGVAKPTSIYIDTFGTNTISEEEILKKIEDRFDLTPRGIINYLELQKPIYKQTTNYGHFGKKAMTWEHIIKF